MNSNQSRTQFESWYQQHFGHSLYLEWNDQGFYESPATGNLFAAWEASRAAVVAAVVVVELPDPTECDDGFTWIEHSDAVKAIEAAGLKVKP